MTLEELHDLCDGLAKAHDYELVGVDGADDYGWTVQATFEGRGGIVYLSMFAETLAHPQARELWTAHVTEMLLRGDG